jgi:hypothetical protein
MHAAAADGDSGGATQQAPCYNTAANNATALLHQNDSKQGVAQATASPPRPWHSPRAACVATAAALQRMQRPAAPFTACALV